ncbi:MAG: response regulator transcription factor [Paracoccaceae bacterium]
MRYLLVEGDLDLAEAVSGRLALDGHAVDHAASLSAAEDCLAVAQYDLILLELALPDGDGRDLLARSRKRLDVPVIVLTASALVSDRVGALDGGADDYLTKPFHFAELGARCRAVLRRRGGSARNLVTLGEVAFDPLAGRLAYRGRTADLRNRETRLLEIFSRRPGTIFSKAHLIDRLLPSDAEITENAIEVYVGRLRRRMEGMGLRIETVRGLGYRLEIERA